MADKEEEVQDTSDYKLDKHGKKVKAHRIVFNKGEDDGTKGIREGSMKKTFNNFLEQHTPSLTEEQLDEIVSELQEVLGKEDPAGKWISDFVHSDNPKFAGKSKEKRKQMALAAYYANKRNEAFQGNPAKEGMVAAGGGTPADKAKLAAKYEKKKEVKEEQELDEVSFSGSHQGKTTLKHIDKPGAQLRMAAHDIKPGIKGYRDRVALLKAAQAQGKLKEEVDFVDLTEDTIIEDYTVGHEKSQFGGYRATLTHKKTGKLSYVGGTAYHKPEHAEGEAKAYADNYHTGGKSSPGQHHTHDRAVAAYRKKAKEAGHIRENWNTMLAHVKKTGEESKTSTATKHDVKRTSTGTVYTKQRDADGMSKEFKRDDSPTAKRGRGRPKKNSFGEAVEFLMGLDEETFESFMEEGLDAFMEYFGQLDEEDKKTLGSYIKLSK